MCACLCTIHILWYSFLTGNFEQPSLDEQLYSLKGTPFQVQLDVQIPLVFWRQCPPAFKHVSLFNENVCTLSLSPIAIHALRLFLERYWNTCSIELYSVASLLWTPLCQIKSVLNREMCP